MTTFALLGLLSEPKNVTVSFFYKSDLKRDDVLRGVFLLVDDDAPVHEDVVEEEELPGLGLPPAGLGEHALAHQHAPRHAQGLPGGPEARLHIGDPLGVGGGVDCNTVQIELIVTHAMLCYQHDSCVTTGDAMLFPHNHRCFDCDCCTRH